MAIPSYATPNAPKTPKGEYFYGFSFTPTVTRACSLEMHRDCTRDVLWPNKCVVTMNGSTIYVIFNLDNGFLDRSKVDEHLVGGIFHHCMRGSASKVEYIR
jgi:hypothetical protein